MWVCAQEQCPHFARSSGCSTARSVHVSQGSVLCQGLGLKKQITQGPCDPEPAGKRMGADEWKVMGVSGISEGLS